VLSPDDAPALPTELRAVALAPREPVRPPARAPLRQWFELRCAEVHPVCCEETLRAPSSSDVVARVCAHGALVHGFTPVWYSAARVAGIAGAVTQRSS
jgi:hypothetical protein